MRRKLVHQMLLLRLCMAGIVEYVARHSPKQSEIVVALQKRIVDGDLRPGSEVPSLLEIAQLHKASTRTVPSAMHHLRRLGRHAADVGRRIFVQRRVRSSERPFHRILRESGNVTSDSLR